MTWYKKHTCGDCEYFTGEECDGFLNEGKEVYDDTEACEDFVEQEEDLAW